MNYSNGTAKGFNNGATSMQGGGSSSCRQFAVRKLGLDASKLALGCVLLTASGTSLAQQLAKKTTDDFDGKILVTTEGSHTVGCNQILGNCLAMAAGWTSDSPDHAVLIVEIGGPSYRHFDGLRLNIDGAVTDVTQKVGSATQSGKSNVRTLGGLIQVKGQYSTQMFAVKPALLRQMVGAKSVKIRAVFEDGNVDATFSGGDKPSRAYAALKELVALLPTPTQSAAPAGMVGASAMTAFPNRSACESDEVGPISRCAKLLAAKYGSNVKFGTLSKKRNADGAEWYVGSDFLTVTSDTGVVKKYAYNDEEGGHSHVPDPLLVFEPSNLLLVRVIEYGEELSFDLIDLKSGAVSELGYIDTPVFSPDGQYFLVNDQEYGAEYPTSVSIYRLASGKATKQITVGPTGDNRNWAPLNARWTSNASFEFTKGTWGEDYRAKPSGQPQTYIFNAGKWQRK